MGDDRRRAHSQKAAGSREQVHRLPGRKLREEAPARQRVRPAGLLQQELSLHVHLREVPGAAECRMIRLIDKYNNVVGVKETLLPGTKLPAQPQQGQNRDQGEIHQQLDQAAPSRVLPARDQTLRRAEAPLLAP